MSLSVCNGLGMYVGKYLRRAGVFSSAVGCFVFVKEMYIILKGSLEALIDWLSLFVGSRSIWRSIYAN